MIAKQTYLSWIANAVNMVVQFAKVPILYSYLGGARDEWFLLVALIGYFALFESGLTFTAVRYLGRSLGEGSKSEYSKLFGLLKQWFAVWGVAYIVLSLAAGFIYFNWVVGGAVAQTFELFAHIIMGTAIALSFNYNGSILMANGYTGVHSLADTAASLFSFALLVILLSQGYGIEGAVIAEVARSLLAAIFKWLLVKKLNLRPLIKAFYQFDEKKIKIKAVIVSQLKTGYANAGILTFVAIDLWVLEYYFQSKGAANYLNMQTVFGLLAGQISVITSATLPRLLHQVGNSEEGYATSFIKTLTFVTSFYGLVAGSFIVFGDQFFGLWIGEQNFIGDNFLFLFAFYYFLEVTVGVWLNLHYAREDMGYAKMFWLAFLIRLASVWLLIGVLGFGMIAVLISKIIGYGIAMYPYVLTHRNKGLKQRFSLREIVRCYSYGVGVIFTAIVLVLLRDLFVMDLGEIVFDLFFVIVAILISILALSSFNKQRFI